MTPPQARSNSERDYPHRVNPIQAYQDLMQRINDYPDDYLIPEAVAFAREHGRWPVKGEITINNKSSGKANQIAS